MLHRDGLEDPLDDAGLVQQQLDQLSTIGRCEYEKTCALLVQLFDQAAQTYQELLQSTNSSAADITVQEGTNTPIADVRGGIFDLFCNGWSSSVCRAVDMAGLYNRGGDRWTGVVCEYGRAGRHGRRVSLSVRIQQP